jgi:superoxide dismutase, Cu-Zn family
MRLSLAIAATLLACGFGCTNNKDTSPAQSAAVNTVTTDTAVVAADSAKSAMADIHGAGDTHDAIKGMAMFTAVNGGVKIVVDVTGLKPGKHGIHIHEKPDLSDPKLLSAGGHFNPGGAEHKHAGPTDPKRHAGDLGNIEVDADGKGHLEITDDALTIEGPTGVVGHSIIIHEKEDDLHTQTPPGNAGGRVAGGVIVISPDSH